MKNFYPFQIIHLRFRVDHINPIKTQLFPVNRGATRNARLLMILIKHTEFTMV